MKKAILIILLVLAFCAPANATVSSYSPSSYTGNGSTIKFAFAFEVFDTSEVVVTVRLTDTGVETPYVEDSDYSVSLTGSDPATGGTVTTLADDALASTQTIHITRLTEQTQTTDLIPGGTIPADTLEDRYDKLTLQVQDLQAQIDRCLKFPITDTEPDDLANSVNRASKYLFFGTDGAPSISSSVVNSEATVSTFMETVLDDATGRAALTTMGGMAVYNVLTYGAAGDGATDDRAAIQAAISAASSAGGGTVFLPEATYNVAGTINLVSEVNIIGEGINVTKIDYSGQDTPAFAATTTISHVTIADMTIDGNSTDGTDGATDGIDISQTGSPLNASIHIVNVAITACQDSGIHWKNIRNSQIEKSIISFCYDNGIYFDVNDAASTSCSVRDVYINNFTLEAASYGILVEGDNQIQDLHLEAVYFETITGNGLNINTSSVNSNITVDGCDFESITGNGINLEISCYITISNTLFNGVTGDAMILGNTTTATVLNCRFNTITGDDLNIGNLSQVTVIGCKPADLSIASAGRAPIFTDYNMWAIDAKTTNYQILLSDNNKTFTNEGAGGAITFSLPTIAVKDIGFRVRIICRDAGENVTINPGAIGIVPIDGTGGTDVINTASRNGDSITLKALTLNDWAVESMVGQWLPTTANITFADVDDTPSVIHGSNFFLSGTATETITDFDDGVLGQEITVESQAAITYDTTSSGLSGSSQDLVTADGDVTRWIYNGTVWKLIQFTDVSADNRSGI